MCHCYSKRRAEEAGRRKEAEEGGPHIASSTESSKASYCLVQKWSCVVKNRIDQYSRTNAS